MSETPDQQQNDRFVIALQCSAQTYELLLCELVVAGVGVRLRRRSVADRFDGCRALLFLRVLRVRDIEHNVYKPQK